MLVSNVPSWSGGYCNILFTVCLLVIQTKMTVGDQLRDTPLFEMDYKDFGTLHTMENLIHWSSKEESYIKMLRQRLALLQREKDTLVKYKRSYEESSGEALRNLKNPTTSGKKRGDVIGSSAILCHLMIDRYVNIAKNLRRLLTSSEYRKNTEFMNQELRENKVDEDEYAIKAFLSYLSVVKGDKFPGVEDLFTSHYAILQTQEAYGINPIEYRIGLQIDTKFGGRLKASHCAKIGAFALSSFPYYYQAVEWLELGASLVALENDESIPTDIMSSLLEEAIQSHNGAELRLLYEEDIHNWINTFDEPIKPNQDPAKRLRGRHVYFQKHKEPSGNESDHYAKYLGLCNGITFQSAEEKARMKCYLEKRKHPYFVLNPIKTEQISEYPYVVKMYNVLGDKAIDEFLAARSRAALSSLTTSKDLFRTLRFRTSMGFLSGTKEYEAAINAKSELLTGLTLGHDDEVIQMVEYVYGRFYSFHTDALNSTIAEARRLNGNRLATLVYFLEEPRLGGVTPFLQVGEYAKTDRGSAIFWINAFKNGTIRQDIWHAACPIIHGNKMIINRWIGYNANFRTFPCSLNQLD